MAEPAKSQSPAADRHAMREVRYQHSREFTGTLEQANASLLVSTHPTGKIVTVGRSQGRLALSFHTFEGAAAIAARADRLAVANRQQVWMLHAAPDIARRMQPVGEYDACYLTRSTHFTGNTHAREIAWVGDELWLVNTLFSCLASLDEVYSFVPRWRPPFVSELAADDRCHLNGLAVDGGEPKYVTILAPTDGAAGWRAAGANAGCIVGVASGQVVARGLSMPHSPRVHAGRLLVLESGSGRLMLVDPADGKIDTVCELPGYTRGLACHGQHAFVGLSKLRESSTVGGLPLAAKREQLKCGIAVVDLASGQCTAWLEFQSGVDEILDVQVLPATRRVAIVGPSPELDGGGPVWLIPEPGAAPPARRRGPSVATTDFGPAAPLFNQGNACMDRTDWEAAVSAYRQALALRPDMAAAWSNLGVALENQQRFVEAADAFRRAVDYDVMLAEPHFNLALVRLLLGHFAEGWTDYEWRWQCANFDNRPPLVDRMAPRWDGTSLADRTVLVYGEQGVGDEVMFASCYAEVIAQAKACVLACDPRLIPLYARSFPRARVCSLQALHEESHAHKLGQFDVQVAAGSLPVFLRPNEASFPRAASYLHADPARTEHWKSQLRSHADALKVGISWRGGKDAAEKQRRSLALDEWLPILQVPGVDFVNLQYGDSRDQRESLGRRDGIQILDWPEVDPLRNLDEFSALVSALDLVISIDNSTVHFAGSLGVPTWALVTYPSQSCWRWMLDRDDTLWYASVRLFRKMGAKPWSDVVIDVARSLQRHVDAK